MVTAGANDNEPFKALQHDKFLKEYASSIGKIALPDPPVVTILSINETAHRVLQALFIVD